MNATLFLFDMRRLAACSTTLIMLIAVAACSPSDLQPTQPALATSDGADILATDPGGFRGAHGFFPLSIGNQWLYFGQASIAIEGDSLLYAAAYRELHELIRTEELFGRSYIVERQTQFSSLYPEPPQGSESIWIRYRQDKSGLYEADVFVSQPPDYMALPPGTLAIGTTDRTRARHSLERGMAILNRSADAGAYGRALARLERKIAIVNAAARRNPGRSPHGIGPPGGVLPDELTRLKYPLHPGQSWTIRDEPLFTSTVEAREVLDLPAGRFVGSRIRIRSDFFDAQDTVLFWFGCDGLLGMRAHLEGVATDEWGTPIGKLIGEEHMTLESLEPVY